MTAKDCISISSRLYERGWVSHLSPEQRDAWVFLLCCVKRMGSQGRVSLTDIIHDAIPRQLTIKPESFQSMLDIALAEKQREVNPRERQSAVYMDNGYIVIRAWDSYQCSDITDSFPQDDLSSIRPRLGGITRPQLRIVQESEVLPPDVNQAIEHVSFLYARAFKQRMPTSWQKKIAEDPSYAEGLTEEDLKGAKKLVMSKKDGIWCWWAVGQYMAKKPAETRGQSPPVEIREYPLSESDVCLVKVLERIREAWPSGRKFDHGVLMARVKRREITEEEAIEEAKGKEARHGSGNVESKTA